MAERIDAHQQFWRSSPRALAWTDDAMAALRRDFLPADLEPLLRESGFDGSVAVQARQSIDETAWLLALADEHAFIRGVVGWVDLCAEDVRPQLARVAAHPKLKGVRHVVGDAPDDRFMPRAASLRGIEALAAWDLAYDLLIDARELPAAVALAQRFPAQRFVLDHIGKPAIRDGEIDAWSRGIAALSRNRNVYCKLSGMVTEAERGAWSAETLAPYMDVIFDWFPPERVMVGSDWPVCTLAGAYADVMSVAVRYAARLSPAGRDAVLGGTAAECYRL